MNRTSITTIIAALVICTSASAQTRRVQTTPNTPSCTLTLAEAPKIRGIGLGTSLEDIVGDFPSVEAEYEFSLNDLGEAFLIRIPVEKDRETFEGISGFRVSFVDERVSFFAADYDVYEPRNVDEFAIQVSEKLGLPKAWKRFANGGREMVCNGFSASVVFGGDRPSPPSLIMFDLVAQETVRKRKKAKEEKLRREEQERRRKEAEKRKVFKP